MAPTEGQNMIPPANMMQNAISLSTLIEFIIQRTYHELTVLSELLPRKSDLDRKIEIYQFSNRTKQLFVRLLALVKWINSANKVEKCARITTILQQQQMIFIETADALYRMAKETLVRARLPCFSLPAAVDVLTTGTYPRLPHCIKEKIVPPDSLPSIEKKRVLSKLTQVIEYRIVTSDLPACMCKPILDNGRVKFLVDHEFEVTLTLMGDMPNLPWRLLKIDILVEDHINGSSSFLVHPKQVDFLRDVVQMRLLESEQPLHDLYNCLHYFCQSLQLEVLHFQAMTLIRERFGEHMKVEEYSAGRSLTVSYWRQTFMSRDHNKPKGKPYHQGSKLNIHVDDKKFGKPLQITHFPQIMGVDGVKCLKQINVSCLSLEKVWTHTSQIRSTIKLKELKRELEMFMALKCEMTSIPPLISIQLIPHFNEIIIITIDDLKGTFIVKLPSSVSSFETSLADSLNSDKKDLRHIVFDIRQQITMKNYKRLIESSPMPLLKYSKEHPQSKNTHIVKLNNAIKNKLVIKYEKEMVRFYLLGGGKMGEERLIEVNSEVIEKWIAIDHHLEKGSIFFPEKIHPKIPTNFGSLSKVLTFVQVYSEDVLCFTELADEFMRRGIANTRRLPDPTGVGIIMTLLSFPEIEGVDDDVKQWLKASLLSVSFRLLRRERVSWLLELVFTTSPFKSKDGLHHLTFSYELGDSKSTVSSFVDDWLKVCSLCRTVLPFASIYNNPSLKQSMLPTVEIVTYSFNKLVLTYGDAFCVDVFYSPKSKNFQLIFSTTNPSPVNNCHSTAFNFIEHFFNENKSLFRLCRVFEATWNIFSHISKLNTSPVNWLKKNSSVPVQNFTIIPQSSLHTKIIFQSLFCIEIDCSSKHVVIRDGSRTKVNGIETFAPIPGFLMFLENFMNEVQSLKVQIKMEDDSQTSPMGVEHMDFMTSSMNFINHNSPLTHKLTTSSPAQMLMHSNHNSPSTMFTQSSANQNMISSKHTGDGGLKIFNPDFINKLFSQTPGNPGSPLEHFLGATYFKRHLQLLFASDDNFTLLTTSEPTGLTAKCEMLSLNLKFNILNSKLQLKIIPLQDPMMSWQPDDLPILEKYFELKVAIFPFKPTRLEAFCNLLKIQYHVLKDFIQILRLDMNPDKNLNWHVQLSLTMPHGTGLEYGLGSCALVVSRKTIFVLKFIKNSPGSDSTSQIASSIVAAFCFDPITNYVQLVESQKNANTNISSLVKRYTEYSIKTNECCLFSCILELINNLQFLN